MQRSAFLHSIRSSAAIIGEREIVVIGSQALHAQNRGMPSIVIASTDIDVFPRKHPELADAIDGAIGELSNFHHTYGYYVHGIGRETAVAPEGWMDRLIAVRHPDMDGAVALCMEPHDLVLAKYVAARPKDFEFNRKILRHGFVNQKELVRRIDSLPVAVDRHTEIWAHVKTDFVLARPSKFARDGAIKIQR